MVHFCLRNATWINTADNTADSSSACCGVYFNLSAHAGCDFPKQTEAQALSLEQELRLGSTEQSQEADSQELQPLVCPPISGPPVNEVMPCSETFHTYIFRNQTVYAIPHSVTHCLWDCDPKLRKLGLEDDTP